jgi:hypothetical protein
VQLATWVQLDLRVKQEHLVQLVLEVFLVLRKIQVLLDAVAQQGLQAKQEPQEQQGLQDSQVQLDQLDQLAKQGQQAFKVFLVLL